MSGPSQDLIEGLSLLWLIPDFGACPWGSLHLLAPAPGGALCGWDARPWPPRLRLRKLLGTPEEGGERERLTLRNCPLPLNPDCQWTALGSVGPWRQ